MSKRFYVGNNLGRTFAIIAILLSILLGLNLLFKSLAHAGESDYDAVKDPTRNVTPAQQAAENFFTFLYKQDYEAAAKLAAKGSIPEVASDLKQQRENNVKDLTEGYKKRFNSQFISRLLEPETLVSYRAGGNDGANQVRVFYTERHEVKAPNGEKWIFFWHMEHLITVNNDGKITGLHSIMENSRILMVLKPENCVKPATCP